MASNKLFQELDLKHKPRRNGYDLSNRCNFTCKAGELLPIWHRTVMPGDKFKLQYSHFTRTRPVSTAAQTKIREYVDFFFVPYRLLWKNAPQVHTNNTKNPVAATSSVSNLAVGIDTPYFDWHDHFYRLFSNTSYASTLMNARNEVGYRRIALMFKLMNHLGFPYVPSDVIRQIVETPSMTTIDNLLTNDLWKGLPYNISLYPHLAYQCIYYNFYRNTQWEDNVPYNYNMDYAGTTAQWITPSLSANQTYWSNPTLFDIHYSNYPKDLFFGVFPDAQYGDEAVVDVDDFDGIPDTLDVTTNDAGDPIVDLSQLDLSAQIGVLELRKAQFLQKYREIRGSGHQDYKALVEKIFGIEVPDTLAYIPQYLGGRSFDLEISEVTNTNLQNDGQASVGGKGAGSGNSDVIDFEAKEHGVLMAIYHCQPIVDYALTAVHFDLTKTQYDDYANPVFDQLGFQELPLMYLDTHVAASYNDVNDPLSVRQNFLGYTTRYFDYKTSVDMTLGDLRETDANWIAPVDPSYIERFVNSTDRLLLNYNFFKVRPYILDPIFFIPVTPYLEDGSFTDAAVDYVTTDQFKVFATITCNAVRPLDYHGVPY